MLTRPTTRFIEGIAGHTDPATSCSNVGVVPDSVPATRGWLDPSVRCLGPSEAPSDAGRECRIEADGGMLSMDIRS